MTDSKKPADVNAPIAPEAPSPARDPDELTDDELDSVSGGMMAQYVDTYESSNFLEA